MLTDTLSPMYEAKKRFGDVHPTRQLLQLLDRVERIEKIIDSAIAVKNDVAVVEVDKPAITSTARASRKARNDKS